MKDEIKSKDMIDFLENVYKDIKRQPTLEEELEKERKFINKIKDNNKDEVKELLEHIEILDNTDYILHSDKAKALLDYITNLQRKYDKALHILADYSMPCELDDFNLLDTDYCEMHCSNDDEQFPKCWDEYIEWSLKDD